MDSIQCNLCEKKYLREKSLNRHIRMKHNDNVNDEECQQFDKNEESEDAVESEETEEEEEIDVDVNVLQVWIELFSFINDDEKNLEEKYIEFIHLTKKALKDDVFKIYLNVVEHFKKVFKIEEEVQACALNLLLPIFTQKIENERENIFWNHFLQLNKTEEKYEDNKEKYDKKVMKKYLDFVYILEKLEDNDYHKRIEKCKKNLMKRYAIDEIEAYRRVCKKKFF